MQKLTLFFPYDASCSVNNIISSIIYIFGLTYSANLSGVSIPLESCQQLQISIQIYNYNNEANAQFLMYFTSTPF